MNKLIMLAAGLLLSAGVATYAVNKSINEPACTTSCSADACNPEDCPEGCCNDACCMICE